MSKISMLNVYLQHPVHFLALDVCKVSVWKKFSKQKKQQLLINGDFTSISIKNFSVHTMYVSYIKVNLAFSRNVIFLSIRLDHTY